MLSPFDDGKEGVGPQIWNEAIPVKVNITAGDADEFKKCSRKYAY